VAKSVIDAIRHRTAEVRDLTGSGATTVIRHGRGFTKTYSQSELDRIEVERNAMRERLLAED
jgi:hypothetical protein